MGSEEGAQWVKKGKGKGNRTENLVQTLRKKRSVGNVEILIQLTTR